MCERARARVCGGVEHVRRKRVKYRGVGRLRAPTYFIRARETNFFPTVVELVHFDRVARTQFRRSRRYGNILIITPDGFGTLPTVRNKRVRFSDLKRSTLIRRSRFRKRRPQPQRVETDGVGRPIGPIDIDRFRTRTGADGRAPDI